MEKSEKNVDYRIRASESGFERQVTETLPFTIYDL